MTDQATPAKVRLTDGLGPLPKAHLRAEALAVMNAGWEHGGHVYSGDQMRAYAAQEVAAALAARKPLTEWQIQALCCAVDASGERPAATALIRAVERAHGIGA